jgi:zinc protease
VRFRDRTEGDMKKLALLLVASSALAAPFDKSGISDWTKQPKPGPEPKFAPPAPKRSKLANGMALVVVENHALPIVALTLVIPGAGTAADGAKPGVADLTADMLDEGAGGMTAIAIAEEQDKLGASIATGAGVDAAEISASTLAKTLPQTLDLVAKIVSQPAFDGKELARVKSDHQNDLDELRDHPRQVAEDMLDGALWGETSAYGHPGTGSRDTFGKLELADVQAFYKDRYRPQTMTLVVAGDVDPKTLAASLDKTLGTWKQAGTTPPKIEAAPAATHKLLAVDRPGAEQSDVRIGIVGLDRKDAHFYQLEVLTQLLGGGFTSRLVQKLREEEGIVYTIEAAMEYRVAPGAFEVSTAVDTPATSAAIAEIVKQVGDLSTTDVTGEELDRAKQNLIRALPTTFATNASTAAAFAELALYGLPDDWYARYADNVRKVTAKDLRALAKSTLPADKLVISVVGDLGKANLADAEIRDAYGKRKPN